MTPIITPFANFLNTNHRTLQAIPQKPIVIGIPESRLLMSWYDREVKIWAIDKLDNVTGALQQPGLENTGRRLVSRLVLGVRNPVSMSFKCLGRGLIRITTIERRKHNLRAFCSYCRSKCWIYPRNRHKRRG